MESVGNVFVKVQKLFVKREHSLKVRTTFGFKDILGEQRHLWVKTQMLMLKKVLFWKARMFFYDAERFFFSLRSSQQRNKRGKVIR